MKRSILVFDLETVLDESLPRRAPKRSRRAKSDEFPQAPYHAIVAIGVALLDPAYGVQRIGIIGEGRSEEAALEELTALLSERGASGRGLTVVGWNSRGFDMPVLVARCMRHGVPCAWYYRYKDARYRYSAEGHLDLMDFLSDFGATRSYTLDIAAKLIGMPGKMGCDGADVGKMVKEGRIEEVRSYCLTDIAQTAAVFLRAELIRGELDRAGYREAMRGLLRAIERDPRLAPMLERVDLDRLLLAGSPDPDPDPGPALVRPAAWTRAAPISARGAADAQAAM